MKPRGLFRNGYTLQALLSATVENSAGCLVWQRGKNLDGYGQVKYHGKQTGVHRVAYELANGPIPEGMTVDHMCFNVACANPAHLRLLTREENSASSRRAVATHCKRGHEYTEANTRICLDPETGEFVQRQCKSCQAMSVKRYQERRRAARQEAAA